MLLLISLCAIGSALQADEGWWLFDAPPRDLVRSHYGVDLDAALLGRLQRAAVRFGSGGSGAFVSAEGLVVTNEHVVRPWLREGHGAENGLVSDGFCARSRDDERPCDGLSLEVLVSTEDVTERLTGAVKPVMDAFAALAARRAARNAIELESLARTGLRSEVVTLYQGAQYSLYRYRRYTDVRLVFTPGTRVATFGGEGDNFEYPRHALDVCLVRAYENGHPARAADFLPWSRGGIGPDQLVLTAGHPGASRRFLTYSDLNYERDCRIAPVLAWAKKEEVALQNYAARGEAEAKLAQPLLLAVQNTRQRFDREEAFLAGSAFWERKQAEELRLRQAAGTQTGLEDCRSAWDDIAGANAKIAAVTVENEWLGRLAERSSRLFSTARLLYRHASEAEKADGARLRPFREANRVALEQRLLAEPVATDDSECVALEAWLEEAVALASGNPERQALLLGGKTAEARANELIKRTKLSVLAERRRLYGLGPAAMDEAAREDPLLALVAGLDADSRRGLAVFETQSEIKAHAYARIARVRRAAVGGAGYPDASSTLRLGFGSTRGYEEAGKRIEPFTKVGEWRIRAEKNRGRSEFQLPPRWTTALRSIDAKTPLNFVCTCDVLGGSSGSPVVDRNGELVGIIFDGNRETAGYDFAYSDERARAVVVDVRAVLTVLRQVFQAEWLAQELAGEKGGVSTEAPGAKAAD